MLDFTDRNAIRQYLKDNNIKDVVQLNELVNGLSGRMIEELLEIERDEHLGYGKYDTKNKETDNSRNGYSPKTVRASAGELSLKIPRDRKGEFEPQVVKKHQTDISQLADQVISMYAKGMTVRDIQTHIEEMYQLKLSPQTLSNMTDRVLPILDEWRTRTLEEIYPIVYIDGIRYKVRDNGVIKTKTVYGVIGIDTEGRKDILGLWIAETESAKYWLGVLTDLKNRGVKDILLITSDDLTGIRDAIEAIFPEAEYQGCVVHVIRNSLKHVSYKDRKDFSRSMRCIYEAPTEEAALLALDGLKKEWGEKYSLAVNVWDRNWERINTMFRFTHEIRKLIYTTNPIESFHYQLRKVTKNRGVFPTDTAALKLLYLATGGVLKKWTVSIPHWNRILAQLAIHFGDRLQKYL